MEEGRDNRVSTVSAGPLIGRTQSDPSSPYTQTHKCKYTHKMNQQHPAFDLHRPIRVSGDGLPRCSDYRNMERGLRFLLICIGKGLSWMTAEVKSKAQRCLEGQWEGPRLMMRLPLLLLLLLFLMMMMVMMVVH